VLIYAFQGACVGLAAVVLVGRLNGASPVIGTGYELHIIAAVVLGGTALFGGIGTILGTVLGIFTIGILENGMVLVGADFHLQRVLIGILLIVAVAYQGYRRRRLGTAES
jgi:ribose/xylose/arabinose/galactoside ABC-type transport system permease subunit